MRGPLPFSDRFGQADADESLILRSCEQTRHDDLTSIWFDRYQLEIEQGVDVRAKQQTVADAVGFGASIWTKMRGFQCRFRITASDRASAGIGL